MEASVQLLQSIGGRSRKVPHATSMSLAPNELTTFTGSSHRRTYSMCEVCSQVLKILKARSVAALSLSDPNRVSSAHTIRRVARPIPV